MTLPLKKKISKELMPKRGNLKNGAIFAWQNMRKKIKPIDPIKK